MIGIFHDEEYRVPVPLARVPDHVVRAVLDAEDERFYDHGPLDLRAMARAMVNNLEEGEISEGGSTITQQLVKTVLLTSKQDVDRKLQEAALAIRLENQMTKDQILERYLNTVYFGNHSYGIQAAAERYYRTDVDKLTVGQATLLAGLIRNPVYADPYGNPEAAKERRDVIVDRMVTLGHLSPIQADYVKAEPMPPPLPDGEGPAPGTDYFTEYVKQQLLQRHPAGRHRQRALPGRVPGRAVDPHHPQPRATSAWPRRAWPSILPDTDGKFTAALVTRRPHQRGGAGHGGRQRLRPDQVQPGHRHPGPPDGVVVQAVHPGRRPRERACSPTTPSSARPRASSPTRAAWRSLEAEQRRGRRGRHPDPHRGHRELGELRLRPPGQAGRARTRWSTSPTAWASPTTSHPYLSITLGAEG